jgi:hypothetical protein
MREVLPMIQLERMNRSGLIRLVRDLLAAAHTTELEGDIMLLTFAANCPDPAAAMDLVLEADDDAPEHIVDRALRMPPRPAESYSEAELHASHPLRSVTLIDRDEAR